MWPLGLRAEGPDGTQSKGPGVQDMFLDVP